MASFILLCSVASESYMCVNSLSLCVLLRMQNLGPSPNTNDCILVTGWVERLCVFIFVINLYLFIKFCCCCTI